MSQHKVSVSKSVLFNVFNKLIVHPLTMWGLVVAFGITGVLAKEAILLYALIPVIMTTMFAVKYNVITLESTSSPVLGTVLALLSMAILGEDDDRANLGCDHNRNGSAMQCAAKQDARP